MTWIVVACAAVAAAVILLALRSGGDPSGLAEEPFEETPAVEPKPGAGMRRVEPVENVPDGYVRLGGPMPSEEAYVVHGLLTANGISSALVAAFSVMTHYTRQPPTTMSIAVFRDQADEAAELLREAGVGEAP